jgi:hypothetical protein
MANMPGTVDDRSLLKAYISEPRRGSETEVTAVPVARSELIESVLMQGPITPRHRPTCCLTSSSDVAR